MTSSDGKVCIINSLFKKPSVSVRNASWDRKQKLCSYREFCNLPEPVKQIKQVLLNQDVTQN